MLYGVGLAYAVFTFVLIIVDCRFAFKSYRKKTLEGLYLARCSSLAALIALSYLISVLTEDYLIVSIMSSVYFVCIDWLLIMMIRFVTVYTTRAKTVVTIPAMKAIQTYAWFETLVFAINPFKEIAIGYIHRNTPLAFYDYAIKPLYVMHLIFTYLMVVAVLGILIRRVVMTPKNYRIQYWLFIAAIMLIVVINALFILPVPGRGARAIFLIDSSIPGYSLGLLIMYWSCFKYRDSYLKQSLSKMVFDNLDQGIALFDYNGNLVLKNDRLAEMIPALRNVDEMRVEEFAELTGTESGAATEVDSYSQQLFSGVANSGNPLRADFMRLRDSTGRELGDLFVYTDASEEIDLLTGFHSWDHFRQYVRDNPETFRHPCAVAQFDINSMGSINRNQGKDAGDQLIREFSELIRKCMPEETYYVRGYDARLIAISYYATEEEMRGYGEHIKSVFRAKIQAGYAASATEDTDILDLINRSLRSMQVKKLLDDDSTHSQTITSLVRALKESDSDTETHVKRTQRTGLELGRRFGLSDLEMSQLSLLCLLHDIGKIGIPLEILNKPGRLTPEEWEVLKSHTEKGYQIAISSWELRDIADMILYHHERWDGKGYPKGLEGEDIPLLSRIISVVDSYDAMINNRSYRRAISTEEAKAEMRRCSGTQFDPNLTEEFLKMLDEDPDMAMGLISDEPDVPFGDNTVIQTEGDSPNGNGMYSSEEGSLAEAEPDIKGRKPYAILFSRYIMDINDCILSVDDDFETITGYTKEDIKNGWLRQTDLIPEAHKEEYFRGVSKQLEKGDTVYMEHELLRKDGRHIYVLCYAKRHYDSASKTMRTEVIITDSATTKAFGKREGDST